IPAGGTVLIGNTGNGTEIPYLTAASAAQTSNTVINFNGNDGIALLNASNVILDRFGTGINATDISYVRNASVTAQSATYVAAQWTSATIATVQTAAAGTSNRLGAHSVSACAAPTAQPTALVFGTTTNNSIAGSFTAAAGADEYLVVRSTASSLTASPVDGTVYSAGNALGGGTVVSRGATTSFTASGLTSNTTYFFFIYSVKSTSCTSGGPRYLATSPLSGSRSTSPPPCATPAAAPTALSFGTITSSSIAASFTGSGADEYLVVRSNTSSLSSGPVNGTVYNAGNALGGGTVVSRGATTSFTATGLTAQTVYYFFVYALNSNCSGGPLYLTTTVLTGNTATAPASSTTLNFYFGNMHAHSSYSDGNADDVTKIPADDYAYAKNSLCMDYLGISEHNHTAAGMRLADWQPGRTQAAAATTAGFVGMYGMEWGVISGGGHVIVYGIDSLIGWDPGEYQIFVAKSVYTGASGLFNILNRHGGNALAYLAHPNNTDYNNVLNGSYDVMADNAIVGSAVESGPAFSTNTTYTNPSASPMSYLSYYRNMLSKGYHLGPAIDHDNHNMTFGRTAKTRTVIMAPSLTENDLLGAMRQMRFYASHDCAAKITFTINGQPMGSILRQAGTPVLSVTSVTTSPVSSLKVMYGVPGSGVAATQLTAVTTGTLNYNHTALANLATGYYYLDITETDGSRIITSPIWYTRDDAALVLPLVTSLFTINEESEVVVKWITENEEEGKLFTVQRSNDDGRTWQQIGAPVPGVGKSKFPVTYALSDSRPFAGRALYRLVQTAINGSVEYSEWKMVNRGTVSSNYLVAFPNPVSNVLHLKIGSVKNAQSAVELFDITGRRVYSQPIRLAEGEQYFSVNLQGIPGGTYILKMNMDGKPVTRLVNKF
ncbi:MAG: T9SS type A sorting domain-containing protein, partial [Dinghuibacter sp.]|nr:T9SS type A sorting domain-containing protein [Dinghuibacter sp.]